MESTSFFTPSCATIQAKSPKAITCPGEKGETTVTGVENHQEVPNFFLDPIITPHTNNLYETSGWASISAPSESRGEGGQPDGILPGHGWQHDGRLSVGCANNPSSSAPDRLPGYLGGSHPE